jgi:two-component system OmpR family response regulator
MNRRSAPVQPGTGYKRRVRILVVEDETALAAQLESALTDAGYAVDRAAAGDRADYLARTENYDAVLLDLGLPRVDA